MLLSRLHPMSQKIDIDTASFTCACGKYNEQVVLRSFGVFLKFVLPSLTPYFYAIMDVGRYRLEVMVSHKEESTKFLLWDRECTDLIGQSADEVNRLKK